jgi:hypothetical protein
VDTGQYDGQHESGKRSEGESERHTHNVFDVAGGPSVVRSLLKGSQNLQRGLTRGQTPGQTPIGSRARAESNAVRRHPG